MIRFPEEVCGQKVVELIAAHEALHQFVGLRFLADGREHASPPIRPVVGFFHGGRKPRNRGQHLLRRAVAQCGASLPDQYRGAVDDQRRGGGRFQSFAGKLVVTQTCGILIHSRFITDTPPQERLGGGIDASVGGVCDRDSCADVFLYDAKRSGDQKANGFFLEHFAVALQPARRIGQNLRKLFLVNR